MQTGDLVVCVSKGDHALTEGARYEVESFDTIFVCVRNDEGNVTAYHREHFKETDMDEREASRHRVDGQGVPEALGAADV